MRLRGGCLPYAVLLLGAVVALFPVALMLSNALKTSAEIVTNPLAPPLAPHWGNFSRAWRDARMGVSLLHSAIVTGCTILLVCSTGSMAAYVIARKHIRSWRLLSSYFLASTTLPTQLFLFPLYFVFARLGLIDNMVAVSFIYAAIYSPFAILLLRTYFLAVPREIEEAALIDGASRFQVFSRVMLPVVLPGILTVALIVGLYAWNEFLIAATFLQGMNARTAVVSFYSLGGVYTADWGEVMAAAVIIVLPVLALFLLLQRQFISGMASGSVKG